MNKFTSKYTFGDEVFVVTSGDYGSVVLYQDTIEEITFTKDGIIFYVLKDYDESIKEDDLILTTDTDKLIEKIKEINSEIIESRHISVYTSYEE